MFLTLEDHHLRGPLTILPVSPLDSTHPMLAPDVETTGAELPEIREEIPGKGAIFGHAFLCDPLYVRFGGAVTPAASSVPPRPCKRPNSRKGYSFSGAIGNSTRSWSERRHLYIRGRVSRNVSCFKYPA